LPKENYWFPVDIEEYIKLANCRVKIIWLGKAFDINQNDNGLVKSIKIRSLAQDLHSLVSQIVLQIAIRTLVKTDPEFLEFLKEIERKSTTKFTNGDDLLLPWWKESTFIN
jgi:hypothetical protein